VLSGKFGKPGVAGVFQVKTFKQQLRLSVTALLPKASEDLKENKVWHHNSDFSLVQQGRKHVHGRVVSGVEKVDPDAGVNDQHVVCAWY
jgi:hypothetical protein